MEPAASIFTFFFEVNVHKNIMMVKDIIIIVVTNVISVIMFLDPDFLIGPEICLLC
jgi:hypothetical protein